MAEKIINDLKLWEVQHILNHIAINKSSKTTKLKGLKGVLVSKVLNNKGWTAV